MLNKKNIYIKIKGSLIFNFLKLCEINKPIFIIKKKKKKIT
jgi:hypothetical protein